VGSGRSDDVNEGQCVAVADSLCALLGGVEPRRILSGHRDDALFLEERTEGYRIVRSRRHGRRVG